MPTTSSTVPARGELLATFRYGKGFLIFLMIFGVAMLAMAGFVLYLSTILPDAASGPVAVTTRSTGTVQFSSTVMLVYATSAFLALIGIGAFGVRAWHKKMRLSQYELYEHGIAETTQGNTTYLPYTEIEDVYLFSSGQAGFSGLITNLAYRRNASEPLRRVNEALKGFHDFQQRFRKLYLNARQPVVLETLRAGGSVTFNCIDSAQVWRKRAAGNFLEIKTLPIVVSRDVLQVQGSSVPMSSLGSVDLSAWSEKVVIKDQAGNVVLSTVATGILSHDLFLSTLALLKDGQAQEPSQAAPLTA